MQRIVDTFGGDVSEAAIDLLEQCWAMPNRSAREALVKAVGPVHGGFRLAPSLAWRDAQKTFMHVFRRVDNAVFCRMLHHAMCQAWKNGLLSLYRDAGVEGLECLDDLRETTPAPSADALTRAILHEDHGVRLRRMMMAAVIAERGFKHWRDEAAAAVHDACTKHADAVTTPEAGPASEAPPADTAPSLNTLDQDPAGSPPRGTEDGGETESKDERPTRAIRRLSAMDEVLIHLIVQSADAQLGSRSNAEMDGIVEEFSHLNTSRFQSKFHRGYAAALFGRSLPERAGSAENDERRSWVLVGWLLGRLRDGSRDAAKELEALTDDDRRTLMSDRGAEAAAQAADDMLTYLARSESPTDIARWIRYASTAGVHTAIGYARKLLRDGRPGDAELIARSVLGSVPGRKAAGDEDVIGLHLAAMTIAATASRMQGNFDASLQKLQPVLEIAQQFSAPDRSVSPAILALMSDAVVQNLLCIAQIKDVPALWFAPNPADHQLRTKLEPIAEPLLTAVRRPDAALSGTLCYCAGLWMLACPANALATSETIACIDALSRVIRDIQVDDAPRLTRSLLPRFVVIRSLLSLRAGIGQHGESIRQIIEYEKLHGLLPFHVVREAIEAGLASDAAGTEQLILARLDRDMHNLLKSELFKAAVQQPAVCEALFTNFRRYTANIGKELAATAGASLFTAAALANTDRARLGELADELIALVHEKHGTAETCLGALINGDHWSLVWDEEDFIGIRARLAEYGSNESKLSTAIWLLDRAHRFALDQPGLAEQCLELAEWLGLDPATGGGVRTMIARRREADGSRAQLAAVSHLHATVMFVGGDIRQERMQPQIRSSVAAIRPNIRIIFHHPGWSSNWGSEISAISRELPGVDAVVLNPLMRTTFGRHVRRAINDKGKQWRSTCGHASPATIARSIIEAADAIGYK